DLMVWMMDNDTPMSVYSVGSDYRFAPDKAPKNAGTRCLLDCENVEDCPYSAAKHYLPDGIGHGYYIWGHETPSREEKIEILKNESPYGRCVFRCGHEGVDHQVVTVTFASGAVGVFTLTGGAPKDERRIQIIGTKGSLVGTFEDNAYSIRLTNPDGSYREEKFGGHTAAEKLHGGGDEALVLDFCSFLKSGKPSLSYSALADSLASHLVIFAAEKSRKIGEAVRFEM
ncbi:MAG: gfo/Idh/MocA family oxidoreductase, partial [Clostridia bacterium]|nr:gfo/Idh/MocA family oxidoreductase [Clostridia bacterium]